MNSKERLAREDRMLVNIARAVIEAVHNASDDVPCYEESLYEKFSYYLSRNSFDRIVALVIESGRVKRIDECLVLDRRNPNED